MAGAVQDHLGHRALAVAALPPGFVIHGLGQALEVAAGVQGVGQAEGRGGGVQAAQFRPAQGGAGAGQGVQAGGDQFRLTVSTRRAGDGVGVVALGDGQGAGVQPPGGGCHGLVGEPGRGDRVQLQRLHADRCGLGHRAAEVGDAHRRADDRPEDGRDGGGLQLQATGQLRRRLRLTGNRHALNA